jgi:competence protein ComEC
VETIDFFDSLLNSYTTKGKAILYVEKDSASALLQYGDRLIVEASFEQPDGVVNPNGFDYAAYLQRQGIGSTAYISADRWQKVGENTEFSIFKLAAQSQKSLLNIYHKFGIVGDEFAILAALTLGSKDALHPELRQNFTTSGGMHILAVSGLHVGIIFMVLSFLFRFLDRNLRLKYLKAFLIVTFLWAYAFVTGLPPSVIRATLMFSLIAIGASLERKSQIYNTVSFAAFVMLLINPDFIFDVGFQLSFSAVISIVYFQPIVSKWLYVKNKALRWLWELVAVSLAAQIGTAPFSLYYFHQFPNYFIITNIVAIPLASIIIYLAVALFVLSSVPLVSTVVAAILNYFLLALNFCVEAIHNLPFSLSVLSINHWQVLSVFAAIILLTVYFNLKKFSAFILSLSCILIFVGINATINYRTMRSSSMLVYSDNKNTHVDFVDAKDHYLYSSDLSNIDRVAESYWLTNKLNDPILLENSAYMSDGFVQFKNKTILILTSDMLKSKMSNSKMKVDYLIVGNKIKPRITDILACVEPAEIIVDKTISDWYTESIRAHCFESNIRFYSVAEKGAYVLNFSQ